jgi:hypothetical protein
MNWSKFGTYLDRELLSAQIPDGMEADRDALREATVLMFFSRPYDPASDGKKLQSVLSSAPLALAVAGVNSRSAFDNLINFVATPKSGPHVMTGLFETSDVSEAASLFLRSTWPANDRFDDWRRHVILVIGDTNSFCRMGEALEKLADHRN